MLALMEVVPYVAFTGAALLVAFVAGELAYKRLSRFGMKQAFARPAAAMAQKPKSQAAIAPVARPEPVIEVVERPELVVAQEVVKVAEDSESVRIALIGKLAGAPADSARIEPPSQESIRIPVVGESVQVQSTQAVMPDYMPGGVTERCEPVPQSAVYVRMASDAQQPEEEGILCDEDLAVRRDSSVRVFDAVVAPSERKASVA